MTFGSAGVPWVLLPGLDGSGALFERFREVLPRGARLRIVSYPDRAAWTLDDYVEHVERSLPPGERPLIVAESFSGPIALRLLCRRAGLAGLVLVASFDGCPNPLLAVANAIPAAVVKAIATSPHLLRFFCLGHDVPPEGGVALRDSIRRLSPACLRGRLDLLRSLEPVADRVPATPILCLEADRDRLVVAHAATHALSRFADVRRIDGPHFLLQARAAECAAAIVAWLAARGGSGRSPESGQ